MSYQKSSTKVSLNNNLNDEMNNQSAEEKKDELGLIKIKTPERRETTTVGELNLANYPMAVINDGLLFPPEEKTKSLLVNVFRTRRSNVVATNESSMLAKHFSVSVLNLPTSTANQTPLESTFLNLIDQKKHALSEENIPQTDSFYVYFNIRGKNFKEKLKLSDSTLRELLSKLFEKHHLDIDQCQIFLRGTQTPVSLDLKSNTKRLLVENDLIVT
ncbi:unnamed protein product, partial [Didymodactylos carnosus]